MSKTLQVELFWLTNTGISKGASDNLLLFQGGINKHTMPAFKAVQLVN